MTLQSCQRSRSMAFSTWRSRKMQATATTMTAARLPLPLITSFHNSKRRLMTLCYRNRPLVIKILLRMFLKRKRSRRSRRLKRSHRHHQPGQPSSRKKSFSKSRTSHLTIQTLHSIQRSTTSQCNKTSQSSNSSWRSRS